MIDQIISHYRIVENLDGRCGDGRFADPRSAARPRPDRAGILRPRIRVDLDRGPGLIRGVTQLLQPTVRALRTACHAKLPPMPDHFVRKIRPPLTRNDPHQVLFNFSRVVLLRQLQAPRDSRYMRIHDHPFILLEPRPEHDVRGFARHAWETLPPKSATTFRAAPTTDFDLLRKKPVE